MFKDTLRLLRKLTLLKILNLLLIQLSYVITRIVRKPLVWGQPFFISIEPSAICQLACPQCPVGMGDIRREQDFLDFNLYQGIIDDVSRKSLILSLYFQGEPLMLEQLPEFVRYAGRKGLYTITSTNGQLLSEKVCIALVESGLDRIIISVDGADQETYHQYRKNGDLQKVSDGIRNLVRARDQVSSASPLIILQFLVFKHNQHQVKGIQKLGKLWGADLVRIKSAQIEYPDPGTSWLPDDEAYSRYQAGPAGQPVLKSPPANRCRRIWETAVITTDGMVVPCCFDKRTEFPMGSVKDQAFDEIWKGRDYEIFRSQVLKDRKKLDICLNCTEGQGKVFIRGKAAVIRS